MRIDRGLAIEERLRKNVRVDPASGCWEWQRYRDPLGYGRISTGGRHCPAHRVSYQVFVGPIPELFDGRRVIVCHTCDNPPCVNPDHLWLGGDAENTGDRDRKGRQVALPGESHGNAVLTEADVRQIRAEAAAGATFTALGERFGVTRQNISLIVKRRAWTHVD